MASKLNPSVILLTTFLAFIPSTVLAGEFCPVNPSLRCFNLEEEKARHIEIEKGKTAQEQLALDDEKFEQYIHLKDALIAERIVRNKYVSQLEANLAFTDAALATVKKDLEKEKSNTPWVIAVSAIAVTLITAGISIGYVQAK